MRTILHVACVMLIVIGGPAAAQTQSELTCPEKLEGRDRALDRLNRQVAQLTEMLSLEQAETTELVRLHEARNTQQKAEIARLSRRLNAALADKVGKLAELEKVSCRQDFVTFPVARIDGSTGLITVRKSEIEAIRPASEKGKASTVVLNRRAPPVWIWPRFHQAVATCLEKQPVWYQPISDLFK